MEYFAPLQNLSIIMINSTVFLKKRKNTVRSGGFVQNVATNVDAEQAQKDVSYEDIIVP